MHMAILYRSLRMYNTAVVMWRYLYNVQRKLYGENSDLVIFPLKNIAASYLSLGVFDQAIKSYEECIPLCLKSIQNAKNNDQIKEEKI